MSKKHEVTNQNIKSTAMENENTEPKVVDEFLATIEALGGEERIIAFLFDNANRKTFLNGEKFSIANNYLPDIQYLVFDEITSNETPYKIYKPIGDIQGIFTAELKDIPRIKTGRDLMG